MIAHAAPPLNVVVIAVAEEVQVFDHAGAERGAIADVWLVAKRSVGCTKEETAIIEERGGLMGALRVDEVLEDRFTVSKDVDVPDD